MSKLEELEYTLKDPAQIAFMYRIAYSDGRQIGESAMVVIDTETGNYEMLEVPDKPKYEYILRR